MELVCPAGTPAGLRAAVDAGADAVYCGFADETNARNFPGLNFTPKLLREGAAYAHARGVKVLVAINTFPRAGAFATWTRAVDEAVAAGADALILADVGLFDYAAREHPGQRLHVSVQAAASSVEAIRFYHEHFGARRVVLPRVLTVAEIAAIGAESPCELEVFVFGGLCVMAEGRCSLSSYATGQSPNMQGVCSPAAHVDYVQEGTTLVSKLNGFTINRFQVGEPGAYPTLCKGRFATPLGAGYVFEEPTSLDAADELPALKAAGVSALKIEGRQRSRAYVQEVVSSFRRSLGALEGGTSPAEATVLARLSEGGATTTGSYRKGWR